MITTYLDSPLIACEGELTALDFKATLHSWRLAMKEAMIGKESCACFALAQALYNALPGIQEGSNGRLKVRSYSGVVSLLLDGAEIVTLYGYYTPQRICLRDEREARDSHARDRKIRKAQIAERQERLDRFATLAKRQIWRWRTHTEYSFHVQIGSLDFFASDGQKGGSASICERGEERTFAASEVLRSLGGTYDPEIETPYSGLRRFAVRQSRAALGLWRPSTMRIMLAHRRLKSDLMHARTLPRLPRRKRLIREEAIEA